MHTYVTVTHATQLVKTFHRSTMILSYVLHIPGLYYPWYIRWIAEEVYVGRNIDKMHTILIGFLRDSGLKILMGTSLDSKGFF